MEHQRKPGWTPQIFTVYSLQIWHVALGVHMTHIENYWSAGTFTEGGEIKMTFMPMRLKYQVYNTRKRVEFAYSDMVLIPLPPNFPMEPTLIIN